MSALLEVRDLNAHYGSSHVLQGVGIDVGRDQVIALFGRNGVGKSTLIHSIMGLVRPTSGSVRLDGADLAGMPPYAIARRGIGLVPQGRRIFAPLTVEENLRIAQRRGAISDWSVDRVYELLPALAGRRRNRGDQLSGGEQQMLAIGRILLGGPRIMLLDEPSDGLAPRIIEQIAAVLAELRALGIPALLVEQNLRMALELADEVYIMGKGTVAYHATVDEFRHDPETARRLLGIA